MLCPYAFAESFEDIYFEAADYQEEISFFVSTGIVPPDDEFVNSTKWTVTKGEFAHLAVMALNMSDAAKSLNLKSSFIDVGEHSSAPFVAFLEQGKLLSETKGLTFRPDDPVTIEFAAEIGVAMTGRQGLVRDTKNNLRVANDAKLFKNVEFYDSNKLSRGEAMKFFKNVMETELLQVVSLPAKGNFKVVLDKGETVLSSCFNLEKSEGVITSDGITTVFGKKAKAGFVGIDGETFLALCTDYYGLVGQYAEYFIKTEPDGERAVQCIEPVDNTILTVNAKDIKGFDEKSVSYDVYLDGKTKSLQVEREAYIAYNFEVDYNPVHMIPKSGIVTFIDHDDNNSFEAVLIYDFVNVVADYYSDYTETIYDKEDPTKNVNLSLYKSYTMVDVINNPVEPTEIKQHNIISVYENPEENTAHIIVSNNQKNGVLKSVHHDDGVCFIGSSEYKMSQDIRFKDELRPGGEYVLYFDALGEVAYVTTSGGIMTYLIQGNKGKGLSPEITLRVLPENTKKLTDYQLAEKVKVQTPDSEDKILSSVDVFDKVLNDEINGFRSGMVLIGLNEENKVNKLIFPMEISTHSQVDTALKYPLYYLSYLVTEWPAILKSNTNMVYKTGMNGFNRWIIFGNDAKIFCVPPSTASDFETESVVVKAPGYGLNEYIPAGDKTYYSKDLSDISVRYMVEKKSGQTASDFENIRPCIVTALTRVYDEKVGETWRITARTIGGEVTVLTANNDVVMGNKLHGTNIRPDKTMIEVGDIVRWITNDSGEASAISLLWDAKKGINDSYNDNGDTSARFGMLTFPAETKWDPSGDSMTAGIITKKSGNIVEYVVDKTETLTDEAQRLQRMEWNVHNTGSVIDFSKPKTEIRHGVNASELAVGDRLVLISYSGQVYNVLVYRR